MGVCLPPLHADGLFAGWGDAALLVLSTPTTAPAIPLATSANAERLRAGTHALIAGWGETEYGQEQLTGELKWAKSLVKGGHQCEGSHFNMEAQICVTHPPGVASGACFGDSGGPLLAAGPRNQGLVEIGLSHALFNHCSTKHPDIYTRADLISPWVDRWIAAVDPPQATRRRRKPSVPVLDNPLAEGDTRQTLLEALGKPFKRRFGYHIFCRPINPIKAALRYVLVLPRQALLRIRNRPRARREAKRRGTLGLRPNGSPTIATSTRKESTVVFTNSAGRRLRHLN